MRELAAKTLSLMCGKTIFGFWWGSKDVNAGFIGPNSVKRVKVGFMPFLGLFGLQNRQFAYLTLMSELKLWISRVKNLFLGPRRRLQIRNTDFTDPRDPKNDF